jgi:hypothetical protein
MHVVFFREAFHRVVFMLKCTFYQVVGYPDVQVTIFFYLPLCIHNRISFFWIPVFTGMTTCLLWILAYAGMVINFVLLKDHTVTGMPLIS